MDRDAQVLFAKQALSTPEARTLYLAATAAAHVQGQVLPDAFGTNAVLGMMMMQCDLGNRYDLEWAFRMEMNRYLMKPFTEPYEHAKP